MLQRARILAAYADTLRVRASLKTRADIAAHQKRLWARLQPTLKRTPALSPYAGEGLRAFPEVDAAATRPDFARRNSLGLTLDEAAEAADAAEAGATTLLPGNVAAGWSTGTSGTRGLFLASPAERARYVGAALATLLPGSILDPWRIALVLRADSALYRGVETAGRFQFRFLGLDADHAPELEAFDPHVLIAPAHVLNDLAASAVRLPSLRRMLAGAEPLGLAERPWIARRLHAPVDPIYQATEGFLAAPCRHGTLHLNEDWIAVERRPLDAHGRFNPVVTDLARASQPIVRQRLDDVLLARAEPCPCGSPLAAIERVEGRLADAWRFGPTTIFPGEVEAELDAVLGPAPWLARQTAPDRVTVEVRDDLWIGPAAGALTNLLADRGVRAHLTVDLGPVAQDGPKRRRVRGLP